MKRETAPCQHDNSITQTQPRKGLDNHSPSAAVLRTGAQMKRRCTQSGREPSPVSCRYLPFGGSWELVIHRWNISFQKRQPEPDGRRDNPGKDYSPLL